MDWIITGASRGIGRALTLAIGEGAEPGDRLFVLARDGASLATLDEALPRVQLIPHSADLSRIPTATAVGEVLPYSAATVPGASRARRSACSVAASSAGRRSGGRRSSRVAATSRR